MISDIAISMAKTYSMEIDEIYYLFNISKAIAIIVVGAKDM
jgi:hypothetical protein